MFDKKNSVQKERSNNDRNGNGKAYKDIAENAVKKTEYGFKKLADKAKIPIKEDGDAGYDLSVTYIEAVEKHNGRTKKLSINSNGCFEVFPNVIYKAHTGIAANMPEAHFGLIKPRSGMSADFGMNVMAGVCDFSYTGEIIVIFSVMIPTEIKIEQRIAQMVVLPHSSCMGEVDELKTTERGSKGFGSSGK